MAIEKAKLLLKIPFGRSKIPKNIMELWKEL